MGGNPMALLGQEGAQKDYYYYYYDLPLFFHPPPPPPTLTPQRPHAPHSLPTKIPGSLGGGA
jgi:hypothetical protein